MRTLSLAILFAVGVTQSTASGHTFLIDQSSGPRAADFADIQPAIDAADDDSLLLVLPGNSNGFHLPRNMTILEVDEASATRVNGLVTISGIAGSETATISSLRPPTSQSMRSTQLGTHGVGCVHEFRGQVRSTLRQRRASTRCQRKAA